MSLSIPTLPFEQPMSVQNTEKLPYRKPTVKLIDLNTATAGKSASSVAEYDIRNGTTS